MGFQSNMVTSETQAACEEFFRLCETGQGADAVKQFMEDGATFSCDALPDITSLCAYVDWMKGIATQTMPGCSYDLHAVTSNDNHVSFFATFNGTHTGPGGPVEPTNKSTQTNYVYIMRVSESGKVNNMVKVWNAPAAFKQLGWA